MNGYIVGIGAANVDISGRSEEPIVMGDSNHGPISLSTGGVTRNILENLSRLGLPVSLITAMGDDLNGATLISECSKLEIDTERVLVVPGRTSSTYMAVLDDKANMLVSICDVSILECLTKEYLEQHREYFSEARALVCDPSLPAETLDFVINDLSGNVPVYVDTVSTAFAKKLAPFAGGCDTIKPNALELEYMTGIPTDTLDGIHRACDKLLNAGARRVVVSRGEKGCACAISDGRFIARSLKPVTEMVNATGAGDSLMAGLIYSHFNGYGEEQALDFGMACGIAAILSSRTINPKICKQLILSILQTYGKK